MAVFLCGTEMGMRSEGCLRNQIENLTRDLTAAKNERNDIQQAMDRQAKQLIETVNDRNRIGTKLDLMRDEIRRIVARIAETGLLDNPKMRDVVSYCERAQKDIETVYDPIIARDIAEHRAEHFERDLTAARKRIKRLEEAGEDLRKAVRMAVGDDAAGWELGDGTQVGERINAATAKWDEEAKP
jgi:chromosome segregation ATPase